MSSVTVSNAKDMETTDALPSAGGEVAPGPGPGDMDSGADSMVVAASASVQESPLIGIMSRVRANKATVVRPAVRAIQKMLLALKKKKVSPKARKILITKNFVIQKYVTSVDGAHELMEYAGFVKTQVKKREYYLADEAVSASSQLDEVLAALEQGLSELDSEKKSAPKAAAGPRQKCVGGCGFWGDVSTENYCSQCWKKKFLGGKEEKVSVAPGKCVTGCGNFGSAKFKNYCSVCWKQKAKKENARRRWKLSGNVLRAMHRLMTHRRPVQKNKMRCWKCNKKVGITGIECRCRYIFCGRCRYPDEHDCAYDYKLDHKKKLIKENQLIKADKLNQI